MGIVSARGQRTIHDAAVVCELAGGYLGSATGVMAHLSDTGAVTEEEYQALASATRLVRQASEILEAARTPQ